MAAETSFQLKKFFIEEAVILNMSTIDAKTGSKSDDLEYKELSTATQPIFIPLLIIWLVTVLFQLGSLAYGRSTDEQSFQSIVLPSILFISLITIPLGGLGIWLGRKVGLGTPLLAALIRKQPGAIHKLIKDAGLAIMLGFTIGGMLVLIRMVSEPYLPSELPAFGHRGVIGGLFVSAGAAVGEEVWFRLGLMTILVWFVARLFGHQETRPIVAWPIIILASIGFGLAHLPQLMSYGAGSPFAIWGTIIGNSMVGILCGWCYWRRSLIAAMIAHFSVDIVIHVFPAFVA